MSALALPALEAPGTEWGRLAVSIPGWRWMPGMHDCWGRCAVSDSADGVQWVNPYNPADQCEPDHWPDPDDPATAGCLLRLLESEDISLHSDGNGSPIYLDWWDPKTPMNDPIRFEAPTIGRVCIMVAVHLGRWPGGAK